MKWTTRAPITLLNRVVNERVNDDKKKEKDKDYEIIMLDRSPTQLSLRPKKDVVSQLVCEVSIH
jgi:hypothetical protein